MTNSSVPTPEALIASFLHPILPLIMGRPTFNNLLAAHKLQKINAAEIRTPRGGGALGYLGVVIPAAEYEIIAPNTPWVTPIAPGPFATIPANATTAQVRYLTDQHNEQLRQFDEHHAIQTAFKKQIFNMIEPAYVEGWKQPVIGFSGRNTSATWTWLYQQYGTLTAQDKEKNTRKFLEDWDPTIPFEAFAAAMDECVEIAAIGGAPISEAQILDNAHSKVFHTALYFETLKQWHRRPGVEQTWSNFKLHMAIAQAELLEEQGTAQRAGYGQHHTANLALQLEATTEALANLATAAATDRHVVDVLTTSNATLTNQAQEYLQTIARLEAANRREQGANRNGARNGAARPAGAARPPRNPRPPPDPEGYCWFHGYRVCVGHSSMTCRNAITDPNHKKEATRANNMGGSQEGRP